ncbi:MAG TPA: hypothetical protein VFF52_23045, partial [Isosphaeraceae bacterium]|nr:hypothetical protein [Isosphaeraceae bacterium]
MPSGATALSFSVNVNSSAKNTTARFYAAGNYTFQATITNGDGFSRTASVSVTVNQAASSIAISPASATVADGNTQTFSASVKDQFGAAISSPSLTWSVNTG